MLRPASARPAGGRRPRAGPLVAVEISLVPLLLAAATGRAAAVVAGLTWAGLALAALVRFGPRRGYRWLWLGAAYLVRRRALPAGGELLTLLRPGAVVERVDVDGAPAAAVVDATGWTVILELGDPYELLPRGYTPVNWPLDLLPPAAADAPAVRLQLLVTTVPGPAPGTAGSPAATSYRQLTEGRVPAAQRAFLAVHVGHAGYRGQAGPPVALPAAVRRTRRRLERRGVPCRPVAPDEVGQLLAELAWYEPGARLREHWSWLRTDWAAHGGPPGSCAYQATFRLRGWPVASGGGARARGWPATSGGADAAGAHELLRRLVALPYCAVTLSLVAWYPAGVRRPAGTGAPATGSRGDEPSAPEPGADGAYTDATLRLTAPDPRALAVAVAELERALHAADPAPRGGTPSTTSTTSTAGAARRAARVRSGATLARLDGRHLAGLAATLPLGGRLDPAAAAREGLLTHADEPEASLRGALHRGPGSMPGADPGELRPNRGEPPLTGAGLMLGVDRTGEPVTVRLVRPAPTRVVLFGGVARAQLLVLRALALGVRVAVHTARPGAWEPFVRGVDAGHHGPLLAPPGLPVEPDRAYALRPHLYVIDHATGDERPPDPARAWVTSLVVRDRLTAADLDRLGSADLVLLPLLSAAEASVAADALGLGAAADWLTRIPPDMLGVLAGAGPLRWALLSATAVEERLVGPLAG